MTKGRWPLGEGLSPCGLSRVFAPLTRAVAILGFSLTGGLRGQELDCFRQHSVCVAPRLRTLCSLFHFRLTTALILYFLTVERLSNLPRITPGRVRGPEFLKQAMGRPFPKVSERKAIASASQLN